MLIGLSFMLTLMTNRTRKLIGTIIILLFLTAYVLVVMVLSYPILRDAGKVSELFFYLIAGLAWTIPAGLVIKWAQKPNAGDKPRSRYDTGGPASPTSSK